MRDELQCRFAYLDILVLELPDNGTDPLRFPVRKGLEVREPRLSIGAQRTCKEMQCMLERIFLRLAEQENAGYKDSDDEQRQANIPQRN